MPSDRLNLNDWSGPRVSERLALLLACCASVFALYGYNRAGLAPERLLAGGVALVLYLLAAGVILSGRWWSGRRQPQLLTLAMLLFAGAAGAVIAPGSMAVLLLIPALHAALLLDGKAVRAAFAACALLWFALNYLADDSANSLWLSLAGLLPAAIIMVVVHALSRQLAQTRNRLTALSYRDELTALLNMRSFTRMLNVEHQKAAAAGSHYALVMVDIHGLQNYNERFGHEQGNRVIVAVAEALKRSTRPGDLIARYGGDEFVLYLPAADDDVVADVSNRIRQNVYNITLSFDRSMQRVQVSTGSAMYPDSGTDIQSMLKFANQALYREIEFQRSAAADRPDPDKLRRQAGVDEWS